MFTANLRCWRLPSDVVERSRHRPKEGATNRGAFETPADADAFRPPVGLGAGWLAWQLFQLATDSQVVQQEKATANEEGAMQLSHATEETWVE